MSRCLAERDEKGGALGMCLYARMIVHVDMRVYRTAGDRPAVFAQRLSLHQRQSLVQRGWFVKGTYTITANVN